MNQKMPVIEVMDDDMAAVLRLKTDEDRLKIGFRMWKAARSILRASITSDHPEWSPERVNREIAWRISHGVVDYGRD
jgi:hypothetical protein